MRSKNLTGVEEIVNGRQLPTLVTSPDFESSKVLLDLSVEGVLKEDPLKDLLSVTCWM